MNESAIAALLISVLNTGLALRGVSASVKQDYQPTQQGIPSTAVILFHHVSTVPIGWPAKEEVYNAAAQAMAHTETQNRESRYQLSALAPQSPGAPAALTAADYVLAAQAVLQSDATINTLAASNVGVRHAGPSTSVWFQDDRNRNQESPSFDIILSHQDVFTYSVPILNESIIIIGEV